MPAGKAFGAREKELYIKLVLSGRGILSAAKTLGFSGRTVSAARKADPEFDQDIRDALDTAAEPVEEVLLEAAQRGEPWAVQMFLRGRLRERWSEKVDVSVQHGGQVEIEAGARLEGIARLQAALAARSLELGLVEGSKVVEATSRVSQEGGQPDVTRSGSGSVPF
jgi:hypothetical protein